MVFTPNYGLTRPVDLLALSKPAKGLYSNIGRIFAKRDLMNTRIPRTVAAALLAGTLSMTAAASESSELLSLYKQYQQAIEAQDDETALKFAQLAYEAGVKELSPDSETLANLKFNLAQSYFNNKDFKQAYVFVEDTPSIFKKIFGDLSTEYLGAELTRIEYGARAGQFNSKSGSNSLKQAITRMIKSINKLTEKDRDLGLAQSVEAANVFTRYGIITSKPKSIERFVENTEEALSEVLQDNDIRLIQTRYNLAKLKSAMGKHKHSIPLYESVVLAIEDTLDTSHPYQLAARASLVYAYEKIGDSDSATEHCIAIGSMKPWEENIEQTPLFRLAPRYPVDRARKRAEGLVRLSFVIDEQGFVKDPEVIMSQGGSTFEKSALNALKQWRYAPKFENGKPVAAEAKVQLDFKMGK